MLRVASIAALLLLAAGCGTQERAAQAIPPTATTATVPSPTAVPAPAVTHAGFVKALNASCRKGNARADRLDERFQSAMERSALREAGGYYRSMMAVLEAHVDRIEGLDPPPDDKSAMRRYLSAEHRMLGYGRRMSDSLLDDDLAGVQLLVGSFQREQKRRITAAIDMGADKCGG